MNDSANMRFGCAVLGRKGRAWLPSRMSATYGKDVVLNEDSVPTCGPASLPILANHVGHVVGLRSEPKVVVANAEANVAFMKDKHALRDRAIGQDPCHAGGHLIALLEPHHPASVAGNGPCPNPARFGFSDLRPEPIFDTIPLHSEPFFQGATPREVYRLAGALSF